MTEREISDEVVGEGAEGERPVLLLTLVLDTSESMSGRAIQQLNENVKIFVAEIYDYVDRAAVQLLIIGMGEDVRVINDWCDARDIVAPILDAADKPALAAGIALALDKVEEQKADYREHCISFLRPVILIISNGTIGEDDWSQVANRCQIIEQENRAVIICIGTDGAKMENLAHFSTRSPPIEIKDDFSLRDQLFIWCNYGFFKGATSVEIDPIEIKDSFPLIKEYEVASNAVWKVFGASVQGSSHIENDQPCQDANAWRCEKGWMIGLVSDGAGSATNSGHGANHCANTVVEYLAKMIGDAPDESILEIKELKSYVEEAIRTARDTVMQGIEGHELSLKDFYATVVGAIVGADGGLFFHIGDGAAVGITNDEWVAGCVSQPENGEYANETFFYTQPEWEGHLRFTEVPGCIDLVILMSDGAMTFAMAHGMTGLEERFIAPVTQYLDKADQEVGNQALMTTLDSSKTYSITGDDKSLLWARKLKLNSPHAAD